MGEGRRLRRAQPRHLIRTLVPWRADGGRRDELARFTARWWAEHLPEAPPVLGRCRPGPFNRAAAINDAARSAGPWEVAIIRDADVICDPAQVRAGIERARETGRLVLPFTRYVGLPDRPTRRLLEGAALRLTEHWAIVSDVHESSVVIVPRGLWDQVGGFDERFVGWGQEDVAFAHAARLLGGQLERVEGRVWHLWHPRSPHRDKASATYRAAQALGLRYRMVTEPEAMRALLAERS